MYDWTDRLFAGFLTIMIGGLVACLVAAGYCFVTQNIAVSDIKDKDVPTVEFRVENMIVKHDKDTSYVPVSTGKTTMIVPTDTEEETVFLKLHDRAGMQLSYFDVVYYGGKEMKVRVNAEDANKIDDVVGVIYVPAKLGAIQ